MVKWVATASQRPSAPIQLMLFPRLEAPYRRPNLVY